MGKDMGRVEGKVAIVTGSAHGMGASHALSLAREGADIAVVDIGHGVPSINYPLGTKEEQLSVVKEIKAMGRRAIDIQCDVSKTDEVQAMVKRVINEFGKVDILVNNAGIAPGASLLWDTPEENWSKVIDVNLTSLFLCCKYVLPYMIKQKSGKIVNIGSINGREGYAGSTAYSASKAGVHQLTFTLAKEVAPYNINVNAVAPGGVKTFQIKDTESRGALATALGVANTEDETYVAICKRLHLFGREITAQDVSNTVLFLSSEESRNITGSVIYVDGGHP